MEKRRFNISRHCINRYKERILGIVPHPYAQITVDLETEGLSVEDALKAGLTEVKYRSPSIDIKQILNNVYEAKDITGQFANDNPRYLLYMKERYKRNIIFLQYSSVDLCGGKPIIFIVCKRKDSICNYDVLTCFMKDPARLETYKKSAMPKAEIYMKLALLKTQYQ